MFSFVRSLARCLVAPVALASLLSVAPLAAHEGHDHGAPPAPVATAGSPRVALHSDAYELVGILRGDRLTLFLDRYAGNAPVTDAGLVVTIGTGADVAATPTPEGTYVVASDRLVGAGSLELVFAITHPGGDDLLIGTLERPAAPAAGAPAASGHASARAASVVIAGRPVPVLYLAMGTALAVGLLLGATLRRSRPALSLTGLVLVLLIAGTGLASAHEGHDHGEAAKVAPPAGDTPRRLADGSVFAPKPTQRLLEIRTQVTKTEEARKTLALVGRVIADPNRSGQVQSITGGRIVAPESGLPRLGQIVRRGDILATVEQAVPQADRTTIAERVGEIEQQIAMVEAKLKRSRSLAERAIAPQSQVIDFEIELAGLMRRREIVGRIRIEPELLRAPLDGVVSAVRVVAGQVVGSQDVLFQIVDPAGLWIEALSYGDVDLSQLDGASALLPGGKPLSLSFRGTGRALQQQATLVHFAVEDPPATVAIGQPVRVTARNGASVSGIILPRDAVVRGGNGEALVWRHTDPERFEPRPIRTEPFDATRLVIRSGVAPGERIVVRGAEHLNQIR
ncbi:MAG: HlyD family efflux transporter periplasmic adaptor subunit [Bosea sp. (in: a-proteobacteria)]|uniref:efflux RND transporter periplasmic adaptor subunit n=1 Tax=Bosea sp. (in: a-proteobacteria) TaxID=1871050 RepID=UPI0027356206|nr:HlyD family efflux transporter periplasmic adaptor subunit [Bosea sp. (in: a-proteobacteria)]MDP3603090.1 HlyD family efflux transporter periplasmic adaptor subunit [Bosea sp. (in: a-proteobacteria)]